MTSQENGFATARAELLSGYPAYFYSPGDASYIAAVDSTYGLSIRLCGDAGPDREWIRGFNQSVWAHIEQNGLPWNSRQSSLELLSDLAGYFRRQASQANRLRVNGEAFAPTGFGFSLSLVSGSGGVCLLLEGESLFRDPQTVPGAMLAYRSGPKPHSAPATPQPPALQPGRERVSLGWFRQAACIECLPAPPGSHLVVFRFSDFGRIPWRASEALLFVAGDPDSSSAATEAFLALDTQLHEWIPGRLSSP
jgi:hypothetical protein